MHPIGSPSWDSRMTAPRPASMRNFRAPASTSVQGPKRSGFGIGTPVPSSVTRKPPAVMS